MVTFNIITILLLIAIFWKVCTIKRAQSRLIPILNSINESLNLLIEYGKRGEEKEINIIKALQEICMVINQSFSVGGQFMNHTTFALQNIAVCMIPFIDEIKNEAIESDNYEKAQECITIIKNLQEVLNAK